MLSKIQFVLMPLSFTLLFCLMLLYWVQAAFFSYTKYKRLSDSIFCLSLISLTGVLTVRWLESGHFPLSNLYESLLFLSWSLLLSQLVIQSSSIGKMHKKKAFFQTGAALSAHLKRDLEVEQPEESVDLLGVILSPLALTSYAFAFLYLPKEMQKATALVPALQSNWLMMHVTVMILSYAALLCGSVLSMAFLLVNLLAESNARFFNPVREQYNSTLTDSRRASLNEGSSVSLQYHENSAPAITMTGESRTLFESVESSDSSDLVNSQHTTLQARADLFYSQMRLCDRLDNYSYRMLGLGFPLLTVGILSGAVWANSAWGSYWSWDPKETWALITWLVFAMYLHARITKGWSGRRAATVATLGFFVVWFCYLGVNLLGTGLHSYGWFTQ